RRHPQPGRRALVETAARSVSRVDEGRRDIAGLSQPTLHLAQPARLRVLTGGQTDETLEVALHVVRAAAEPRRQRRKRRMALDVGEVDARAADLFYPRIGRHQLVGPATAAGSVSAAFGFFRRMEEGDAIAPWPPARTRRPAVHARGADRVDERTIGAAVVREHCLPACRIVGCSRRLKRVTLFHATKCARLTDSPAIR